MIERKEEREGGRGGEEKGKICLGKDLWARKSKVKGSIRTSTQKMKIRSLLEIFTDLCDQGKGTLN